MGIVREDAIVVGSSLTADADLAAAATSERVSLINSPGVAAFRPELVEELVADERVEVVGDVALFDH